MKGTQKSNSVLEDMEPSKAIIKLAIPATLALLAKAVYNLVDTAYIGMLHSDIALTAVGVTVPLLLIMVSIENIFAAGAAVLAGRQLGAKDEEGASRTVTTVIGLSVMIGILLCVGGIVFIDPLMRAFGASDTSLQLAKDYAFWMFVAALANLPAQSMNWNFIKTIALIGIPTAVIQICLSVAASLTNIAASALPQSDEIIAAYGVVQRLILIGCYVIMGFMQGYQPVASYAFGARNEDRFHQSVRFALKGSMLLTVLVAAVYIILAKPLICLFNGNPVIVNYGRWLLISQVIIYPAFGLCYMMTITYQTIGASRYGLFLSAIRQGLFYIPFILILPKLLGIRGIYFSQPAADILTILVCVLSIKSMKKIASKNMGT